MTTLTIRASAHSGNRNNPVLAAIANAAAQLRAYRAARLAEKIKKADDLIVSGLDPHVMRDIGLDPAKYAKRVAPALDSRTSIYCSW